VQFQLAAWRPGRYELADFAQNIQKWSAFDEHNNPIPFTKITKDLWEVTTEGVMEVTIVYNFYANQLDAGACYLDEHQLYLNPVHCMFYIAGKKEEEYTLNLEIPTTYKIASSMEQKENTLSIKGYDALAESPIICSDSLQHGTYDVDGITFHSLKSRFFYTSSCLVFAPSDILQTEDTEIKLKGIYGISKAAITYTSLISGK
jgi:predicted metalloprotease with PDZ domain